MIGFWQQLGRFDYEDHKNRIATAYPGTCQWFLTQEKYHAWRRSEESCFLWLSFDPGCGKSVLVRHLADIVQPAESGCVCYFFFKADGDPEQRDLTHALSAILHQMFAAFSDWIDDIKEEYDRHGNNLINMRSKLLKAFTQIAATKVTCRSEIICLLDAVDECQDFREIELLIKAFHKLLGLSNGDQSPKSFPAIKFLVSSRPYAKIERCVVPLLRERRGYHIDGNSSFEEVSEEVKVFTVARINGIGDEIGLTERTQDALIERLTNSDERSYLWITLIFAEIRQMLGKSEKKALAVVDTLPQTVSEAYEKILTRVSDKAQARKVLYVILAAERPLTLSEIDVALEFSHQILRFSELDLEGPGSRMEFLRQVSGLFVTVVNGKVYFIHETARTFLLQAGKAPDNPDRGSFEWHSSFSTILAQEKLAEVCVRYLQFAEFEKDPLTIELTDTAKTIDQRNVPRTYVSWDSNHKWTGRTMKSLFEEHSKVSGPRSSIQMRPKDALREIASQYPFLNYAATHWLTHVYRGNLQLDQLNMTHLLDIESSCFKNWLSVYWGSEPRTSYAHLDVLRICMAFNLHAFLEVLLQQGTTVDALDNHARSPLHCAAQHNLVTSTKLLLAAGASVNLQDNTLRTPLHEAVLYGNIAVVEVLLESGAQPNLGDYVKMAPLHLVRERIDITKLLVKYGAKLNQKDQFRRLPIALAMYEPKSGDTTNEEKAVKYIEVIEYLVARGTNVRHALRRAHFEGLKEAIWIICRHVGKPDLITAIELGWQEDITRLLESGEDPNRSYLDDTTPLHCAASKGNKDLCAFLLEHGAYINAQCCYRKTPLTQAITSKNFELVKFLVTKGADVYHEDLYGTGILNHFALYGDHRALEFLLSKGLDPNSPSCDGTRPLHACISRQDIEMRKTLLACHADLHARGPVKTTALILASEVGTREIVELLLQNGASVHDRDAFGRSPLFLAVSEEHWDIAELLLEQGHSNDTLKDGRKLSTFVKPERLIC
ncbi:hypothetical protein N7462_001174 [Penicillium macrosclerotiorum]|uniref:uncharacterized protein n=1 Tax=Penicillium macrosclerotiorum TaxID=303699 RepID=UPI002549ACAA|nr:uncharacterized protein N7462_001174 [Penicillium macrosclerotiorum]KAJ5691751.1 hypothetical protein N7462_001174 [Penicillium macrosclerotiorum]